MFGGVAARAQGNTCTILLPHYSRPTTQHSYVSIAASNLAKIKELTTCPPDYYLQPCTTS